jgi:hypothetical protein
LNHTAIRTQNIMCSRTLSPTRQGFKPWTTELKVRDITAILITYIYKYVVIIIYLCCVCDKLNRNLFLSDFPNCIDCARYGLVLNVEGAAQVH